MTQKVQRNEKLLLNEVTECGIVTCGRENGNRDRLYTSRHLAQILKLAGIVPKKSPSMAIDLATILQELHYLLIQGLGEIFSGVRRVFYSLDAWVEKLPWLSRCTIRRRMLLLQEAGLIKFGKEKASSCWHVFWYELDYSKLEELDARRAGRSHRELKQEVSQYETSTFHQLNIDVSRDDIHIINNSTQITHSDLSQTEREEKKQKTDFQERVPKIQNKNSFLVASNPFDDKYSENELIKKPNKGRSSGFWLPDGPWRNSEGNLDPNFRDWLASDWMARYGGTIHQRRADVLSHFKKDPANLVIRWEQYQGEYLHRYQNAAMRMRHGVAIDSGEQEQLMAHQKALSHSEEIARKKYISTNFRVCNTEVVSKTSDRRLPTEDFIENPSAYQLYQIQPDSTQDLASPEQLRALFSRFSQKIIK